MVDNVTQSVEELLKIIPDECWVVTMTQDWPLNKNDSWFVKLAVKEPHVSLPAVRKTTLVEALTEASLQAQEYLSSKGLK